MGSVVVGGILLYKMKSTHNEASKTFEKQEAFVDEHPFLARVTAETADELPPAQYSAYKQYQRIENAWLSESQKSLDNMWGAAGASWVMALAGIPLLISLTQDGVRKENEMADLPATPTEV